LTILGIVIGVASVITIMSLGDGMQSSMESQLGGLGGDILTLTAGQSRGSSMGRMGSDSGSSSSSASEDEVVLDLKDVLTLKNIPDIDSFDTQISGTVEVSYLRKSGSVKLTGVDQKVWSGITTQEILAGRMLDSADQNVVIIGSRLAEDYFDKPIGINQMITIETNAFRVVGILDDSSTNIYMPIKMSYQVLDDKTIDVYDSIIIKVADEEKLDETIEKIESKLLISRHVNEKDKDFSITSSKAMQETRAEMMSSMNLFLLAIAAVSLIVGAVGIANTMFTSVLEKTKEIGIMKAIGARNKDILMIFLLHSGLIGLVGGVLGIIFGVITSSGVPFLMGDMGMFKNGAFVSLNAVIIALSVSVLIGLIAGTIPAIQASKLKPVDALRYE